MLAGCGEGSDLLLPGDGEPASIRLEYGGGQSARVGEPLPDSLVFVVRDSRGRPVEGARIAFDLAAAGPGADVVPDTALSDANGEADARMVLGTTIGDQVGEALVVVGEGVQEPRTTFTMLAYSENANGIAALSGEDQSGPAGTQLGLPLVVQVTDAFGNPIAGVPITWTPEGGGSVSEASNLTDGDGRASVQRTLGPVAGPQSTLATSTQNLAGSPVTFIHTATAGSAAGLSIESGNGQTAQVGTELPGDLVVRLVDASGNGVPGAGVTWVVGTGGGSVSPQNSTTDEAGRTSARWTLGRNPGENRVDAVVSGVGVVGFTAVGTVSRPAALTIVTQPPSSVRNGEIFAPQPVIQVRDAAGNPAATPGIVVTAQLSDGGGELLGTRQVTTDASGRATFTDLAIAGTEGGRRLVFTAPGYAGVTSTVVQVRAIATATTITSDSPDPSVAGGSITVAFRVTAEGVTPIGSLTVTDGVGSCTGTLFAGSGTCTLPLNTTGPRTLRATYSGSAGLTGSFDTESHQVNPVPVSNNPPTANFTPSCTELTCRFSDASTDSDGSVVSWAWTFGDGRSTRDREPVHTYATPGTYTVTLTVTDNSGVSDQASANITVDAATPPPPPPPVNQPPVAAFTWTCDELRCSFDSDGSSDSDGRIDRFSWNFDDGSGSDDRNPRHDYTAAGTYNVALTVTDDDGASSSVTHQVSATPDNKTPDADFDVRCQDLTCTFTDKSKDDDGSIVSRSWNYGDGSPPSDVPSHTYSAPGKYTVTLTVTDNQGATDTRERDAEPTAPTPENQPPNPQFTENCTGLTCNFQDTSTDDRGIASRSWNFGDPASGGANTSTGANPSHTFSSGGRFTVTLTVTDTDGESRTTSHDVEVTAPPPPNEAPRAAFTAPACTVDQVCQFTDASSDSDGSVTGWD